MNVRTALYAAFFTVALDFAFHFSLTSPMEVPLYFAAKFVVAFLIAYSLVPKIGVFQSAVIFTTFFNAYYYFGVILLHLYFLTSSPTQVISIVGIMDPFTDILLWTFVHGLFFYAGARLAIVTGGGKR